MLQVNNMLYASPFAQYDYSFRTEHSAAARLPPSPTRTSLSSEA